MVKKKTVRKHLLKCNKYWNNQIIMELNSSISCNSQCQDVFQSLHMQNSIVLNIKTYICLLESKYKFDSIYQRITHLIYSSS